MRPRPVCRPGTTTCDEKQSGDRALRCFEIAAAASLEVFCDAESERPDVRRELIAQAEIMGAKIAAGVVNRIGITTTAFVPRTIRVAAG